MTALFFDPHGDDLALFCAYSVLREDDPFVVVPYRTVPPAEVNEGLWALGVAEWSEEIPVREWSQVYAPAWSEDGHEQHTELSDHVRRTFVVGTPVTYYTTYAPRGQRTRTDNEVPYEPWMVARKLRALSCFVSQIEQESTRPWFTSLLDLREWYA